MTTFIKAEEQNYSLYNYVNKLNSDIDTIEEQNKAIASEIHKHAELSDQQELKKETLKERLQTEVDTAKDTLNSKEHDMRRIEEQMTKIQSSVEKMVKGFKTSKFFLSVAQNMNYDEETVFTDQNVTQFLGELEEYISSLITYTAHKRELPNAAISAIPLEKLGVKEFDKGMSSIISAEDSQIAINQEKIDNVFKDDENSKQNNLAITGKDLYKKF